MRGRTWKSYTALRPALAGKQALEGEVQEGELAKVPRVESRVGTSFRLDSGNPAQSHPETHTDTEQD